MEKMYRELLNDIGKILERGRTKAYSAVNSIIVRTYWEIGRQIVEYEQKGEKRAIYGAALLERLSKDMKTKFGKGFSRRNILDMRRFYTNYQIWQTLSAELNWSHYVSLLYRIIKYT